MPSTLPRFVVLHHVMPHDHDRPSHWDLLLEADSFLKAWSLASEPMFETTIPSVELPPHRILYLDYEGPIQGNRGVVTQWDKGVYEILQEADGLLVLRLHGTQIDCVLTMQCVDNQEASQVDHLWNAEFAPLDDVRGPD